MARLVMTNNPKTNIIPTYLLSNKDINKLWKILGRISDDPNNEFNLSQDAEVFIGYYE